MASTTTNNTSTPKLRPREAADTAKRVAPRVLALARPHRGLLTVGFIALGLASALNLFFPLFIQGVLDNSIGLRFPEDLRLIVGLLIGLFGAQAVLFAFRHYAFTVTGYRVVRDLRTRLFEALLAQDVAFFDSARPGDLLSRISSDAQYVQNAVAINLSVAVRYLVQVIGGAALMFWISPLLASLLLVLIPVLLLAGRFWGAKLRRYSSAMQTEVANASVIAEEALGAIKTVRLFAGDRFEQGRFREALQRALRSGEERARVASSFSSTMVFLLHSTIAAMLAFGANLVVGGDLTTGSLAAFILYGIIVAVSFGLLINVFDDFMHAVGASERIFAIIDNKPSIQSPAVPAKIDGEQSGKVVFERVSFIYPARPDRTVLKDVSFTIEPGRTTALVGPSGSGKSTIAALIPRFYDPTAGRILYAGQPLQQLAIEDLRREMSFVSQEPQLFSASIGENIRYGDPTASEERVQDAARAAYLHDFIVSLPEGYGTLVGSRGVQLSGGQRQRVAIARALLKNPKFLILDEATSALDSESEHLVRQALQRLMEGRTTLIIAHRLSTVQHADLVLVLRDGEIIERGTHRELMANTGVYKTLVEYQML